MTASKQAAKLWAAAQVAAETLTMAGADLHASVQIGVKLPEEVARELVALAGVPLRSCTYEKSDPESHWLTLYSFEVGKYGSVKICGQGDRPATPEEIAEAKRVLAGEPVTVSESQAEVVF